jgi:capsular polysaccharide export protein
VLRQIVDMMLQANDPYEALRLGNPAPRLQLHLISQTRQR